MKKFLLLSATFLALASPCYASGVSILHENSTDWTPSTLPGTTYNPMWVAPSNNVSIVNGSLGGQYRSPFENAATPGTGVAGWNDLKYTNVLGGGQATYNTGKTAAPFGFIWGSPDTYNSVSFYTGKNATGTLIGTITGSQLTLAILGLGHDTVSIDVGQAYESVRFSSGGNSFEFTSPTPLPGALAMFGTVVAGAGALMRRRKIKSVQVAV